MDALVERLNGLMRAGTPAERRIARFFAENLADLTGETAASIADRLDLSPMTVGRFLRNLGYHAPQALKADLDSGSAPEAAVATPVAAASDERPIAATVRNQLAAIAALEALTRRQQWAASIHKLARSRRVFVTAYQGLGGIGRYLADQLAAVRDGVSFIDGCNGGGIDLLTARLEPSLLVIIDYGRFLSKSRALVALARKAGHDVLLITDQPAERTADHADLALSLPKAGDGSLETAATLVMAIDLLAAGVLAASDEAGPERARRLGEFEEAFSDFLRN